MPRATFFCFVLFLSFYFTPTIRILLEFKYELYSSIDRLLGEGMKHDAALRALMGDSKAQQKQRLQERLEKLRKLKQEGGQVDEGEMAALEQVESEGIDAVDAEVLNHLIEETMTDTEEVTTSTLLNDLSVRAHRSLSPFLSLLPSLSFPRSPSPCYPSYFLSVSFSSPLTVPVFPISHPLPHLPFPSFPLHLPLLKISLASSIYPAPPPPFPFSLSPYISAICRTAPFIVFF